MHQFVRPHCCTGRASRSGISTSCTVTTALIAWRAMRARGGCRVARSGRRLHWSRSMRTVKEGTLVARGAIDCLIQKDDGSVTSWNSDGPPATHQRQLDANQAARESFRLGRRTPGISGLKCTRRTTRSSFYVSHSSHSAGGSSNYSAHGIRQRRMSARSPVEHPWAGGIG
jgi:hypothetical protein